MRIIYCGYRKWAYDILKGLINNKCEISLVLTTKNKESGFEKLGVKTKIIDPNNIKEIVNAIQSVKPDYILFYGWSWFVKKSVLDLAPCIGLHPSPLPKYRGGSPLQHQIIAGEKKTMITLFYMTDELDNGDIIIQKEMDITMAFCGEQKITNMNRSHLYLEQ